MRTFHFVALGLNLLAIGMMLAFAVLFGIDHGSRDAGYFLTLMVVLHMVLLFVAEKQRTIWFLVMWFVYISILLVMVYYTNFQTAEKKVVLLLYFIYPALALLAFVAVYLYRKNSPPPL